jgi:hypothetical protein
MKNWVKKDSIVVKRTFSKGGKQDLTIVKINIRNNEINLYNLNFIKVNFYNIYLNILPKN